MVGALGKQLIFTGTDCPSLSYPRVRMVQWLEFDSQQVQHQSPVSMHLRTLTPTCSLKTCTIK